MYMSKPGINIKIIFIVTSVNKFTVPPLRTLRIPERKTCLPTEKPGGCMGYGAGWACGNVRTLRRDFLPPYSG